MKSSRIKLKKQMEKELASLDKEVNKKVAKIADLKDIDEKEKKLKEKEYMLNKKEEMLEKGVKQMKSEEKQIKNKAFRIPVEDLTMKGTAGIVEEASRAEKPSTLAVYSLIEQARHAITANDFNGAKSVYDKIQEQYSLLKEIEDKKKVYYEIMELKTDIELGMLG